MINEDKINKLMSYLYDEMSMEEKRTFEKELKEDPELLLEWQELSNTREDLAGSEDREVFQPVVFWDNGRKSDKVWRVFRPILAVAASISLVILTAYLTNFELRKSDEGFLIGFQSKQSEQISEEKLSDLVNERFEAYELAQKEQLVSYQNKIASLETMIAQSKAANVPQSNNNNLKEVASIIQENNLAILREYLRDSHEQQTEYFNAMLQQFSDYVEEQRYEDLVLIQQNMAQLQQAQQQQQEQTDIILASIGDVKQ